MKFLKGVFLAAALCAAMVFARTAKATCSTGGFYNAYPSGVSNYPTGTLSSNNQGWPFQGSGEFFEWPAASGLTLATSRGNELFWLDVTSGELKSKWTNSPQYKRSFIDTGASGPQFRAVFYAHDWYLSGWPFSWVQGSTLRVASSKVEARFNMTQFENNSASYRGVHLFQRYRSEDEFYVLSLRTSGDVVLKHQSPSAGLGCPYTTLKSQRLVLPGGSSLPSGTDLSTGAWYKLTFSAFTNAYGTTELQAYVNDVWQFTILDTLPMIADGLAGVRTDYVDTWLDDIKWTDL